MIKRSFYALAALTAILMVSVGLAPTSAHATSTSWALPTGAYDLQVGPDSAPRALECLVDGSLYSYDQAGVAQFVVDGTGSEGIDIGCGNLYAWDPIRITDSISASGNSAMAVDTNADLYAETIRLYDSDGLVVWDHAALDECGNPARIKAAPVISNGVVVYTYESCVNWRVQYATGLDETDHSVVYNTSLDWVSDTTSLAWYEGGVTFKDNGTLRYLSDAGVEDLNKQIYIGWGSARHTDGSVVYKDVDPSDSNICYMVFHTYGQSDIQKSVDCGTEFNWAQTLPNGDFVGVTSDNPGDAYATITVVHKATGVANTEVRVLHPGGAVAGSFSVRNLLVDANGKIIPVFQYAEEAGVVPNRAEFARVGFDVFDGSSGAREFGWSSSVLGSTAHFVLSTGNYGASTFNGGIYLVDIEAGRLVRVDVPGLSLSYTDSVHWGVTGVDIPSYVALGDSYSAGTGLFNYDLDARCFRSTGNYAYYISEYSTAIDSPQVGSCHGAITDDLFHDWVNDVAQLKRLKYVTELVTITIGGNDAGFREVLTECAEYAPSQIGYGCSTDTGITLPVSQRMSALAGTASSTVYTSTGREIHSIKSVLSAIVTASPLAEVYVAGYPQLFGTSPASFEDYLFAPSDLVCNASEDPVFSVRVDYADAQWLNTQAELLNTIIENAVDDLTLEGKHVHFVPLDTFSSHALCDSQASWINGVFIENLEPLPESFHPNESGWSAGYGESFLTAIFD